MSTPTPFLQYPEQQPQRPPEKKGLSTCLIVLIVGVAVAVPALGVMAALGIYGVRRYIVSAKSAEAKNTVGAISRSAVAAYEREQLEPPAHRLCRSAKPVPAYVPAGKKHMPAAGEFGGDADTGWRCLKFEMTQPFYYQYQYNLGGGWAVPAHAPGKDAFEAAAVGDLDGNGVQSHFTRTGKVERGAVVVSTELYVDHELE
jgi:type IV pilus assembly protein PilA